MAQISIHPNSYRRQKAEKVYQMLIELYEPGNQSKSKIQVFRKHIVKVYPMSERTFWRLLSLWEQETCV